MDMDEAMTAAELAEAIDEASDGDEDMKVNVAVGQGYQVADVRIDGDGGVYLIYDSGLQPADMRAGELVEALTSDAVDPDACVYAVDAVIKGMSPVTDATRRVFTTIYDEEREEVRISLGEEEGEHRYWDDEIVR